MVTVSDAVPRFDPKLRLRLAVLLAVLGFAISFVAAAKPLMGDGKNYGLVARSLLTDGDIRLDEFETQLTGNTHAGEGGIYNYFPLGPSLLVVPFFAVTSAVVADASRAETIAARCAAASCFAGAMLLLFLVALRFEGMTLARAGSLALIFGFCSGHFPGHVGGLSSHGSTVPLILAAFLALTYGARAAVVAGALLVLAYVMRPTTGLLVPLTALWLLLYHRQGLPYFLAAVAVAVAGVALMNGALYGHVQPPYNRMARLQFATMGSGLLGNLVSPSRGLLFFAPWVAFAAVGVWKAFMDKALHPLFKLLAVASVAHYCVVACFSQWWGGWCYGPRLLYETTPELTLLLVPVLPALFRDRSRGGKLRRAAFVATVAYSLVVAILGITRGAGGWNARPENVDLHPERLWDFSDPQMLRPLRRE